VEVNVTQQNDESHAGIDYILLGLRQPSATERGNATKVQPKSPKAATDEKAEKPHIPPQTERQPYQPEVKAKKPDTPPQTERQPCQPEVEDAFVALVTSLLQEVYTKVKPRAIEMAARDAVREHTVIAEFQNAPSSKVIQEIARFVIFDLEGRLKNARQTIQE
jgi:hypothetical protein